MKLEIKQDSVALYDNDGLQVAWGNQGICDWIERLRARASAAEAREAELRARLEAVREMPQGMKRPEPRGEFCQDSTLEGCPYLHIIEHSCGADRFWCHAFDDEPEAHKRDNYLPRRILLCISAIDAPTSEEGNDD